MPNEFYGKGIKITSGFDLGAKSPLDTRSIVNTIEERDAHVVGNRAYIGMKVYVLSEAKEYLYNGTDWEEVGGISDEELQQLTVAYNHSQTAHITEEYVNQAISEAHENIQLDNYVTKEEFDSLEQIQTSESRPTDEDISIWIDISDDAEMDEVARINDNVIANNITWSSERIDNAIKDDLHNHDNKEILDEITQENIEKWNKGGGGSVFTNTLPEDDEVIWFSESVSSSANEITYDNPLINELFSCIQTLQRQVAKLQEDVEYIKIHGGGNGSQPPSDGNDDNSGFTFLLEDGGSLLLEDGAFLLLENAVTNLSNSVLLLEDGAKLLLENGSEIILE